MWWPSAWPEWPRLLGFAIEMITEVTKLILHSNLTQQSSWWLSYGAKMQNLLRQISCSLALMFVTITFFTRVFFHQQGHQMLGKQSRANQCRLIRIRRSEDASASWIPSSVAAETLANALEKRMGPSFKSSSYARIRQLRSKQGLSWCAFNQCNFERAIQSLALPMHSIAKLGSLYGAALWRAIRVDSVRDLPRCEAGHEMDS